MNVFRLLLSLAVAMIRPARGRHRSHHHVPCAPRVPRQARRVYHGHDTGAELLGRALPHWRVVAIPVDQGERCYVATRAAHVVRARTPAGAHRRMRDVDQEPPPALVRPYFNWKASP